MPLNILNHNQLVFKYFLYCQHSEPYNCQALLSSYKIFPQVSNICTYHIIFIPYVPLHFIPSALILLHIPSTISSLFLYNRYQIMKSITLWYLLVTNLHWYHIFISILTKITFHVILINKIQDLCINAFHQHHQKYNPTN